VPTGHSPPPAAHCRCRRCARPAGEEDDDELPAEGDNLTASEARRRLEAYRKRAQAAAAAKAAAAPGERRRRAQGLRRPRSSLAGQQRCARPARQGRPPLP
jgi:hypothetical protein